MAFNGSLAQAHAVCNFLIRAFSLSDGLKNYLVSAGKIFNC